MAGNPGEVDAPLGPSSAAADPMASSQPRNQEEGPFASPGPIATSPSSNDEKLQQAARNGDLHEVEKLIEQRAEINSRDIHRQTPLCLAIRSDKAHDVALFLIEHGAEVNSTGDYQDMHSTGRASAREHPPMPPLMLATSRGTVDVVKALIGQGAEVNAHWGPHTALCIAAGTKHMGTKHMVKYLIEQGADVNAYAPLFNAVEAGNTDVVKLLIENGAEVNHQNPPEEDNRWSNGVTALHIAAQMAERIGGDCIKVLIERRAEVNATSGPPSIDDLRSHNRTPLHFAKNWDAFKILIEQRANVDAEDADKKTPVMLRLHEGNDDCALYVIQTRFNKWWIESIAAVADESQTGTLLKTYKSESDEGDVRKWLIDSMDSLLQQDGPHAAQVLEACFAEVSINKEMQMNREGFTSALFFEKDLLPSDDTEPTRDSLLTELTKLLEKSVAQDCASRGKSGTTATPKIKCARFEGMCSLPMVNALKDAALTAGTLDTDESAAIADQAWNLCRPFYFFDVLAEVGLLLAMTSITMQRRGLALMLLPDECTVDASHGGCPPELWALIVTIVLLIKMWVDELAEFVDALCGRFSLNADPVLYLIVDRNIVDWALNSVEVAGLLYAMGDRWAQLQWNPQPAWQDQGKVIVGIWALVRWTRVVYSLKAFAPFGKSVLPIEKTLLSTGPFIALTFGALLGLTHFMFVLGTRDDPPFKFYSAMMLTFRLAVLGDVDRFEMEGTDTIYVPSSDGSLMPEDPATGPNFPSVIAWVLLTTCLVNILLLQLLVGILGSNYDLYQGQARKLFTQSRCQTIIRMSSHIWYRKFLTGGLKRAESKFFAFAMAQSSGDEDTSVRTALSASHGLMESRLKIQIDEVKKDSKKDVDEVKARLAELKDLLAVVLNQRI